MLACHPASGDAPLFQIPHDHAVTRLADSAARKHFKDISRLRLDPSLFMNFAGVGPPGLSEEEFQCKTSRHRELGIPIVFGDISHCPPSTLPRVLMLSDPTSLPPLLPLPLLGV